MAPSRVKLSAMKQVLRCCNTFYSILESRFLMQPLHGIRVIDLTRILSGPFCTTTLADLGAEVIKIEPPGGDDTRQWGPPFASGESTYYLSTNHSKKSIVLDLKTEIGKRV